MYFEYNEKKPDNFTEDWDGQYQIIPWMAYIASIPHVIYLVTTFKEDGTPNAALEGWSSFTGEGDNYFVIISGLLKSSHTYQNIKRDRIFCVNFLSSKYIDQIKKTISENEIETDEIRNSGFTLEKAETMMIPRIKESFLKLECQFEWEKELIPGSTNITVCGRVIHISVEKEFARSNVSTRFNDSFMFHLMAMKDPITGKRIRGGIGKIDLIEEMDL
ncbi:MAG: flavin reductase [Candidatus Heimdallarchaeota archaeon]|nr:MAG: flavin reductase [Candidatus Heimdallarchaeota archaeon]